MKQFLSVLLAGGPLFIFGCNNSDTQKTVAAETASTIPASSFKVIMMQHPVRDFGVWKNAYDKNDSVRRVHGVIHYVYGRSLEDSNMVFVVNKITEGEKAKDFADLPKLQEDMKNAGVIGKPEFAFADIIRNDDSKIGQRERVMLSHRVKDFNAWLNGYDNEGMNVRREHGLVDRAIGRDLNDSNRVYIVFAITDIEKAKKRVNSGELKKLMTEAGVEGPTQAKYYRLVD